MWRNFYGGRKDGGKNSELREGEGKEGEDIRKSTLDADDGKDEMKKSFEIGNTDQAAGGTENSFNSFLTSASKNILLLHVKRIRDNSSRLTLLTDFVISFVIRIRCLKDQCRPNYNFLVEGKGFHGGNISIPDRQTLSNSASWNLQSDDSEQNLIGIENRVSIAFVHHRCFAAYNKSIVTLIK